MDLPEVKVLPMKLLGFGGFSEEKKCRAVPRSGFGGDAISIGSISYG